MNFKKLLPLAAASVALSSTVAFADVDTTPAPADWSGFYVGAEGGWDFGSTHFALPGDTDDVLQKNSKGKTELVGGGLVGYNWQAENIVYGVEADATSGDGTTSATSCNAVDGCFVTTHDSFTTLNHIKTNWSGRLRARVGFLSMGTLFYAAGGYSYADTKMSLVGLCYNAATPTVPLVFNYGRSKGLSGFNIGAGMERAFGDHFVARVEYVYNDYGSNTYPGSSEWNDRKITSDTSAVRVAVAYHF